MVRSSLTKSRGGGIFTCENMIAFIKGSLLAHQADMGSMTVQICCQKSTADNL